MVIATYTGNRMSTIDGFTIRNGNYSIYTQYGGGVYFKVSSPIIANNTITDNRSTVGGAGIYSDRSRIPWIVGNTITNNKTSGVGGGVLCMASAPTIEENTFTNNEAELGAAIGSSSSSLRIMRNTIKGNKATSGGGIYCSGDPSPLLPEKVTTIADNVISGNEARYGGGIYAGDWVPLRIINDTVTGNRASDFGGGVYSTSPALSLSTIVNCTIAGNSSGYDGGGIYAVGIYYPLTVANTVVAYNSSGIYDVHGKLSLRSNCVYGNTSYNYSGSPDPTGTRGNISANPAFVRSPSPGPDGKWGHGRR